MSFNKYINPEFSTRSPLSNLRDQLGRFFDLSFPSRTAGSFGEWSPALDAYEDKDKFVVSVEVPGLKKEDINVVVHEGVLTISGERKSDSEVKDGTVHRTERYYGKFSRSVNLPAAVKASEVTAAYKDGVLTVEVPKAEEAKPKSVEVKIS